MLKKYLTLESSTFPGHFNWLTAEQFTQLGTSYKAEMSTVTTAGPSLTGKVFLQYLHI